MKVATPEAVMDLLGIEYFERPNRLAFCCPFHPDRDPSAGFYLDTKLAHCFSCEYTLDMVSFYAKHREISRGEAERELTKEFGELPKAREIDRVSIASIRGKAERELRLDQNLGMKEHAEFGEALDRCLLMYERAQIAKSLLDNLLEMWYNSLREVKNARQTQSDGAPATGSYDRFKEELAKVSGAGRQDSEIDLD